MGFKKAILSSLWSDEYKTQYSMRLIRKQPAGVLFGRTDVNSGEQKEGMYGVRDDGEGK